MLFGRKEELVTSTTLRIVNIRAGELALLVRQANGCAIVFALLAGAAADSMWTGYYMYHLREASSRGAELVYAATMYASIFFPLAGLWRTVLLTTLAPRKALHGAGADAANVVSDFRDEMRCVLLILAVSVCSLFLTLGTWALAAYDSRNTGRLKLPTTIALLVLAVAGCVGTVCTFRRTGRTFGLHAPLPLVSLTKWRRRSDAAARAYHRLGNTLAGEEGGVAEPSGKAGGIDGSKGRLAALAEEAGREGPSTLVGMWPEEMAELRALQRRVAAAARPRVVWQTGLGELGVVVASAALEYAAMAARPYLTPTYLLAYHVELLRLAGYGEMPLGGGTGGGDASAPAGVDEPPILTWPVAVLAATVTKLSASVDDAVWLLPFVSGPSLLTNGARAVQYIMTMCGVAAIGSWIGTTGAAYTIGVLLDDRSIALLSGIALAAYACTLFRSWQRDRSEIAVRSQRDRRNTEASAHGAGLDLPPRIRPADRHIMQASARRLLSVSLLGAMDDLAVCISLLLGRTLSPPQLIVGVGAGSTLVTFFCLLTSRSSAMARRIRAVPLFAVVAAFAAYTLLDVLPL